MNSPPGPKWMCSSVYDSGDENGGRGDDRYSLSAIVAVLVNRKKTGTGMDLDWEVALWAQFGRSVSDPMAHYPL